ncbi:MAG: hypothetical protein GY797_12390 [Deltaproteobacteria bacterium]|nr:hypothetical protein [Deltaproteobacteria bacterium]
MQIREFYQNQGLAIVKMNNGELTCRCPACSDGTSKHPRLYISTKTGQYKCHNCNIEGNPSAYLKEFKSISKAKERVKILESYNLTNGKGTKPGAFISKGLQKLTEERPFHIPKHHDGIYDYRDEDGKIIYSVIKLKKNEKGKKRFIQFRPDGNGGFLIGRGKTKSLLYRLPELLEAEAVIICEGEKDVDTIRERWKVSATCNTGGAAKWEDRFCKYIKGKKITIVGDRDEPDKEYPIGKGQEHAWTVAKSLYRKVESLKVVDLPHVLDDEPIKDISDFIEHPRGQQSHFLELVKNSKEFSLEDIPQKIRDKLLGEDKEGTSTGKKCGRDNIQGKYFNGKEFIPELLKDDILKESNFIFTKSQFFEYSNGVWEATEKDNIAQIVAQKLGVHSRIKRVQEVVESIRLSVFIKSTHDIFDKSKDLINVKNGMLDWKNEKLLKHDKKYYSTIRINATYDKASHYPRWARFLEEILEPELIPIIQEFFGLCLIPDVTKQKTLMLTGSGANGKGKLLAVLTELLGHENVSHIPLQKLGNRFLIAELHQKLANIFTDLGSGALLDTGYFKALMSGDRVVAERKHGHPFSFNPFARHLFSCNEKPRSNDRTYAFFRRWTIIPFSKKFEGRERDDHLEEKLIKELDGIFLWALEGLMRLYRQGNFSPSQRVERERAEYERENNNVLLFISECCEIKEGLMVRKTDLYNKYKDYCTENICKPWGNRKFNEEIEENKFVYESRKNGASENPRVWKGIGLMDSGKWI